MSDIKQRQEAIEKLSAMIGDIPVAMLVTSTAEHALRSRPMVNINTNFNGDLWFFSHRSDPKVREVTGNPQVNVTFISPDSDRYISVSGTAAVDRDPKRIEMLWTDACQKWFPKGKEDPQLALLRIDVDYAEYWDEKIGVMKELSGLVKQAMTGAEQERSLEHEKIDWQQPAGASGGGN